MMLWSSRPEQSSRGTKTEESGRNGLKTVPICENLISSACSRALRRWDVDCIQVNFQAES